MAKGGVGLKKKEKVMGFSLDWVRARFFFFYKGGYLDQAK